MQTSRSINTLKENGVSIWLDDLSRERLQTGSLKSLIDSAGVTGVTTNPTIFKQALSKPELYHTRVTELAAQGLTTEEVVFTLMSEDVAAACDVFSEVYASSDKRDGYVSIEVSPDVAHDSEATFAQATDLWKRVNKDNAMVKIPATDEGLPAITQTLAAGINVNVTLIFHPNRYAQVLEAFTAGMRKAQENGHDLSALHSVASFFVSRCDSAIENIIQERDLSDAHGLIGTVAIANARNAYELFSAYMQSEEYLALQAFGARPQRLLYASTGMKNPTLPPTLYVDELVAPHIVNTMPEATLSAVRLSDKQHVNTIANSTAHTESVLQQLHQHDIDLTAVTQQLEHAGVASFSQSWQELLEMVEIIQRG